uniref:RING-type domain-containing protein n=1 Tax=Meloidogyne enterolobii TaxID=390850 RepID=A0A6V7X832_MELEN|nr:unnamed protein product [Meloidogyne enterolobii]
MRQNFQKLQAEKDACLAQKDEKINFLEEETKKANELFDKKNNELSVKLNNMYIKYVISYKFGCCIICQSQLDHENVYILKNCNHTYHHYCITRWITEGSKNCPCCRVSATLTDIKQFFVEKASDSSDDSCDEFTQSSSNMTKAVNYNLNSVNFGYL